MGFLTNISITLHNKEVYLLKNSERAVYSAYPRLSGIKRSLLWRRRYLVHQWFTIRSEHDKRELAWFLSQVNSKDESNIGYCGCQFDDILNSLNEDFSYDNFLILKKNKSIEIAIGLDCDDTSAEVWGPFLAAGVIPENEVLNNLFSKMQEYNKKIETFNFFVNEKNAAAIEIIKRYKAEFKSKHFNMEISTMQNHNSISHRRYFDEKHRLSFSCLHNDVFKDTYYDADTIAGMLNKNNKLLIDADDTNEITGYLFYMIDERTNEATIEYIGVMPSKRGKGIGTNLIRMCLDELAHAGIKKAKLTVSAKNNTAIGIYEKIGFTKSKVYNHYIYKKST